MKKLRNLLSVFALACLLPLAAHAQVHEYHLKNGLTLLVKPITRAPVVISEIWYKVGSSDEHTGVTGISHILEHMMFEGTPKYPEGKLFKIIAANGGQVNAATSSDYTYYYELLAANKLPLSFKLEADRMQHLSLTPKAYNKEIKVVREERLMRLDNNPQNLTYERFAAAAFIASPYHHPVIGWMYDLKHINIQQVRNWYHTWYAPNNATVVVVGDVKPAQVYQLAKKYFGKIPAKKLPKQAFEPTAPPLGERYVTVQAPAKLPFLIMGYNVPSLKTAKDKWQAYALETIAAILDQGDSSRIPQDLIRGSQIASAANVGYGLYNRLSTAFVFSGIPSQGHTTKQLQAAFEKQVSRLQNQLVSREELQRVKNQLVASHVFEEDSIVNQANMLGTTASVGLPWQTAENYVSKIEKITPQQIQAVAKQYFINKRLTVATLKPLPIKPGQIVNTTPSVGGKNVH